MKTDMKRTGSDCHSLNMALFLFSSLSTLNSTLGWGSDLDDVAIAPAGDQTVKKGEAVELQCKTKASTEYTLVWKKVTLVKPNTF